MIFKLVKRVLDLSGEYKNRIRVAFLFSVLESILPKNSFSACLFNDCRTDEQPNDWDS